MPIYEYRASAAGCAHCAQGFDAFQSLSDAELTECPECGQACTRIISAPNLAIGGAHLLKEKNFAEKGFTQYRKVEKGLYEKTAGKGPDMIGSD